MSAAYKVTYYLLTHHSAFNTATGGRIYANAAKQGVGYPLCVISGVGRVEAPTQDADSAIDTHRIQIDLFADDLGVTSGIAKLTTLSAYVREALARITGTIDGVLVNGIQSAGERDDYDRELQVHRKILDFQIRLTI